jgi:hypothetical protein
MDGEHYWGVVNCELFLSIYGFFASTINYQYLRAVKNAYRCLLLALIPVGSLQMVHFAECVECFLDTVLTYDI